MAKNVNIETARLTLRTVTMDDVEAVALTWKLNGHSISHEEAGKEIRWMLDNHERNEPGKFIHLCLAIIHKENNEFIGWCGLDHRDPIKPNPVLFYLLKEEYWGRGLATEAAKAVLKHAFCTWGLDQVDSGASAENAASKRVMEKAGLRYLGREGDGGYSFTLTKQEYVDKFGCD
jgi:RimJ/RimL family protein N-acetyltransferase